jgi:hypothetical protein
MGSYVDLQVEHREFGLEVAARDTFEDLRIQHLGHAVGADEIQFDLQPHQVLRTIEPLLRQESLQARQAPTELAPVALAIGQVELTRHDLLSHRSIPSSESARRRPCAVVAVTWDDAPPKRSITSPRRPGTRYAGLM